MMHRFPQSSHRVTDVMHHMVSPQSVACGLSYTVPDFSWPSLDFQACDWVVFSLNNEYSVSFVLVIRECGSPEFRSLGSAKLL